MREQTWCHRLTFITVLAGLQLATPKVALALDDRPSQCPVAQITEHVREQFREYGPRSKAREFFGFIYEFQGRIASAVTQSHECAGKDQCLTDTAAAARKIPKGARVLGEWHTHPTVEGSKALSSEDVRGAHQNRRIRCYTPYYSAPAGTIYRWDVNQTSVPSAMHSREMVGNFQEPAGEPEIDPPARD